MPSCVAINCSNRQFKGCGRTFHLFPFGRPSLLKEWIMTVRRDDWTPSRKSVLCSDHFTDACFDRTGQTTRLRADAVPTLFNFPTYERKRRRPSRKAQQQRCSSDSHQEPEASEELSRPQLSMQGPHERRVSDIHQDLSAGSALWVQRSQLLNQGPHLRGVGGNPQGLEVHSAFWRPHSSMPAPHQRQTSDSQQASEVGSANAATSRPRCTKSLHIQRDHCYSMPASLTVMKRKLNKATRHMDSMRKKLKMSQQRTRRLKRKVKSLQEIVVLLANQQVISNGGAGANIYSGIPSQFSTQVLQQIISNGGAEVPPDMYSGIPSDFSFEEEDS